MAQALAETIFDVLYLGGTFAAGLVMVVRGRRDKLVRLFGAMAVVLSAGDAFHLVPRMAALWGSGLAANAAPLGIGKLVTSVTMTVFYLMLYYVWRRYYHIEDRRALTGVMWALCGLRVALCLFPQNQWTSPQPPVSWGILRNLPFAAMGIIVIVLFARQVKRTGDRAFRFMPLAVALSFLFYIPVVLWAERVPMIGMLMIPKTLAYVWIVAMGWRLQKRGTSA